MANEHPPPGTSPTQAKVPAHQRNCTTQVQMDRIGNVEATRSNLLKKNSDTSAAIIGDLNCSGITTGGCVHR